MQLIRNVTVVIDWEEEYFKCHCGNYAASDGFEMCDRIGNPDGFEYVIKEDLKGCKWYKCNRCGQVFYEISRR